MKRSQKADGALDVDTPYSDLKYYDLYGDGEAVQLFILNTVYHGRVGHAAGVMHFSHISLLVIDIVGALYPCLGDYHH